MMELRPAQALAPGVLAPSQREDAMNVSVARVPDIVELRGAFDRPLRIGIMLDSLRVPRWVEQMLVQITGLPYLELALVVQDATGDGPPPASRSDWFKRQWAAFPYRLWEWYLQADYRRFRSEGRDPFEEVDITPLVSTADVFVVDPLRSGFVDRFRDDDVDRIKAARLDVLLRFGFRILKGKVLHSARFGIWSLHHDDNRMYRGGPALFWEMYERNPESGTVLQILTEALDGGKVIYRSVGATNFASLHKNRREAYWKAAEFIPRRLWDLWREGWDFLESLDTYNERDTYSRRIYKRPTNTQMLGFLGQTFAFRAKSKLLELFDERWIIAFRHRSQPQSAFKIVKPKSGHFYADPFIAEHDGRTYILFEDYSEASRKGSIGCIEIGQDGTHGEAECVLQQDYHLSYPSLFRWQQEWWMVPESGDHTTVEVYRATDFPRGWKREAILLDGVDARDATLVEWNGRWWMFVTICLPGGPRSDELSLFVADTPLGPWQQHPRNPIVSDVRRARSAGALYIDRGALVRPAQDNSRGYGYAITFNRIDCLTETDYRETPVGSFGPTWCRRLRGTHTINRTDRYEVVDGRLFQFRRSS
jgi:hypothetical protein